MVYGILPFDNENPERMYELIMYGDIKFNNKIKTISPYMKQLIQKVLDSNLATH